MGYVFCGIALCVTIVGIPWGVQCFKIAVLVLWPFGKTVESRPSATGCLSPLFNIVWLLSGGLYTALVHLVFGLLLAITVIGLPFARQHFKLVRIIRQYQLTYDLNSMAVSQIVDLLPTEFNKWLSH